MIRILKVIGTLLIVVYVVLKSILSLAIVGSSHSIPSRESYFNRADFYFIFWTISILVIWTWKNFTGRRNGILLTANVYKNQWMGRICSQHDYPKPIVSKLNIYLRTPKINTQGILADKFGKTNMCPYICTELCT